MSKKRKDVSRQITFAILDVKTLKLNAEIKAAIKAGKKVGFTISGTLDQQQSWDGVSYEWHCDVGHATIFASKPRRPTPTPTKGDLK